ncbi:MAG: M28 family peptidase [Acidobacteriota bacterium]
MSTPSLARTPARAWSAIVLLVLLLALVVERSQPPAPRGAEAPPSEFSAARARAVLGRVLGDGSPHPIGSRSHDAVRERILAELRQVGAEPEVRSVFACDSWGTCATTQNVWARLPGTTESTKEVLLAAHYDSVGAGPGVSDDGVGVAAVLETVRALRSQAPLARSVVVWIDDGEESGLLGAEAFATLPEAKSVGAVVNLEARGTRGASLMFETRKDNAWVIRLLARALPHPATNSVFYTIYQYLPNDTDFSVFKREGLQGVNFAFVGDVTHYHTPLDDLAHVSGGSLQHHGENALAMVRAFAGADLESPPTGDEVYFDLLSLTVVHWPAGWTLGLAIFAFALVLSATVRLRRGIELRAAEVAWGIFGWLAIVVASALSAFAVHKALVALGALPLSWVAHPAPTLLAIWVAPLAVGLWLAPLVGRRAGEGGLWVGAWTVSALIGVTLAMTFPGTSYLFVVPALVAGACGSVVRPARRELGLRSMVVLLPAVASAALIFPLGWGLWDGLGVPVLAGIAVAVAFVVTTAAPALARATPRMRSAALLLVLVAASVAIWVPARSADHPESVNLWYLDDRDTGRASVLALPASGTLPSGLSAAAAFTRPATRQFPWQRQPALETGAAPLGVQAPELLVLERTNVPGGRRVRLSVRSVRGAGHLRLFVPGQAELSEILVAGRPLPAPTARDRGASSQDRWFTFPAASSEAIEITATIAHSEAVEVLLQDWNLGLPPAAGRFPEARGPLAVPSGVGDLTIVQRRAKL